MGDTIETFYDPLGDMIFGGRGQKSAPAPAPPPPPPPPSPMPTADSDAVKAAQRRKIAADQARSGRLSTILTDQSVGGDKLGG